MIAATAGPTRRFVPNQVIDPTLAIAAIVGPLQPVSCVQSEPAIVPDASFSGKSISR